jgi:hypothetical protein
MINNIQKKMDLNKTWWFIQRIQKNN